MSKWGLITLSAMLGLMAWCQPGWSRRR
nr:IPTL-CTERM sorting domain-containing protein [Acidovorax sp. 69]